MAIKSLKDYVKDNEIDINKKYTTKQIQDITWNKQQKKGLTRYQPKKKEEKGNFFKRSLYTAGDIISDILQSPKNLGYSIFEHGALGIAQIEDIFGFDERADYVRKKITDPNSSYNKNKNKIDIIGRANDIFEKESYLPKKADIVTESIGDILTINAAGGLGKAFETAAIFVPSSNEALKESYQKGATDEQAWSRALSSGGISVLTERMFGLFSGGKGWDTKLANKATEKLKNGITKVLVRQGIQATFEAAEEVIEYTADQARDKMIDELSKGKGAKFHDDWDWEQFGEQAAGAFISSVIFGGLDSTMNVKEIKSETGKTTKQAIQEYSKQLDVANGALSKKEKEVAKKMVRDQVQEIIDKGEQPTAKQIKKIQKNVENDIIKGNVKIGDIEGALRVKDYVTKETQDAEKQLGRKANQTEMASITKKAQERFQQSLEDSPYLQNVYTQEALKSQNFNYDTDNVENEYSKGVYESATAYLNDTTNAHNLADTIAKLSADQSTPYEFTNNEALKNLGLNVEGKSVNGLEVTDENGNKKILINVDSNNALNAIVGHETTHLLEDNPDEYKDLKDAVFNYAIEKGEYYDRKNKVTEIYKDIKDANVERELTADLVGDYLFTDDEFVKSLATNKPTLFQRIKEIIDDLIIRFKGTKEERLLREMQKSFREAYRTTASKKIDVGSRQIVQDKKQRVFQEERAKVQQQEKKQEKQEVKEEVKKETRKKEENILPIAEKTEEKKKLPTKEEMKKEVKLTEKEKGQEKKSLTLQEQLEKQGEKVLREAESKRQAMIENFKTYLEENNITKPTQEDINNSLIDNLGYDNEQSISDNARDEKLYNKYVREYMKENNIPFEETKGNKYSLSPKGEMVDNETGEKVTLEASESQKGNLMVLHNIDETKFNYILDLNGIPVPSIAITNPEKVKFNKFGDGTLIFSKDTINPETVENEVYDSDIYSTRFPTIDRELLTDEIDRIAENIGISDSSLESLAEQYNNIDDLANRLARDWDIAEKYINDNNIKVKEYSNEIRTAEENGIVDYLKEQLKDIYGEKGIYNDKSYIDDYGNRRTFWQQHEKYNLENLVKIMTNKNTQGSENTIFTTASEMRANMANKFNTLEEIKNSREKIISTEEMKKIKNNVDSQYEGLEGKIVKYYNGDNTMFGFENVAEAINETAKSKSINKETLNKELSARNINNVPDNLLNETIDFLNGLSNLSTEYFEAKPQRAVGLNEINIAAIPNNWSKETKQRMAEKNIDFVEYDPTIEGDRQRVINQFEDLKFSISREGETPERIPGGIYGEDIRYQEQEEIPNLEDILSAAKSVKTGKASKTEKTSLPLTKNQETLRVAAENIANEINTTGDFDATRQRGWIESLKNSDAIEDKSFLKDLDFDKLKYQVQTNQKSLDTANDYIKSNGYENSLNHVKDLIRSEKTPSASDIALMQRMTQEAIKNKDYQTAQDLIMDTAILGTDLGQAVQALSIIKKLTPEGQLKLYTKIVNRAKIRGEKAFRDVEITPNMVENVLDAYNEDGTYDQDDLNKRVEEFKKDIAEQMKSTVGDKVNAWRYLSMLGNPKTHIRNIVSNIAMKSTIKVKNAMARTFESVLPIKDRTKTWKKASPEIKSYAKQTAIDMKDIITGENKYNEKTALEQEKQVFKNKALEKVSRFNSYALEAEDWFFSKNAFETNFSEYLTANGINTIEDVENNPDIVQKAKTYAVEQAEIATFRQYSKLASEINRIERNGKLSKYAINAVLPFKKTPINVAKAGFNYSPLGLIKNVSYDAYQLKKGNISASQFIDNISQGLTGTSIALLGYALAKAGVLSGGSDDDKEDKYEGQLGKQSYAINIGGNSYSISWLSPTAMPLLVGANLYEKLEEDKDWSPDIVMDTLAKTLDPMSEMSFLSSLTDTLKSYSNGGLDMIKNMGETATQSYILQFFPTLLGQIANTLDDTKRSTKVSNDSGFKFGEETVRKIMLKIPGLRNQLEAQTDIWGNEKEQADNILTRAFESFLAPYSRTEDISTSLDEELKRVYGQTGETSVIPGIPQAYIRKDNETYKMSASEYTQYKKTFGQTANQTLNELIKSDSYKDVSDEDKVKMIENVYKYAREQAKQEYFNNEGISANSQQLDKVQRAQNQYGVSASEYYGNMAEYNYADKNPDKHLAIKQIGDYNDYTEYKEQINAIKKQYSNTNDRKNAVFEYINSLPLNIEQKLILQKIGAGYSVKNQRARLTNYIENLDLSADEKQRIDKVLFGR